MKTNVDKIASLSKIGLDAAQRERLEKDVPVILSMAELLREGGDTMYAPRAVTVKELRADTPGTQTPPDLSALSQREKEGYVCVVRTVESC